jgi:hypothetical protein
MRKVFCAIIIPACIFIGCAPVISKGLRREISRDITFKKIHLFKAQKEKFYAYPYPHWYYPPWYYYPYWYP